MFYMYTQSNIFTKLLFATVAMFMSIRMDVTQHLKTIKQEIIRLLVPRKINMDLNLKKKQFKSIQKRSKSLKKINVARRV